MDFTEITLNQVVLVMIAGVGVGILFRLFQDKQARQASADPTGPATNSTPKPKVTAGAIERGRDGWVNVPVVGLAMILAAVAVAAAFFGFTLASY